MLVRVGVEGGRRAVLKRAAALGAPLLVSANSLWNDRKRRFGSGRAYRGFDIALDSGGFVAMKRYGRYRWQVPDYVRLARDMRPTWWAQMDFCCEPEIAGDSATVWARIGKTVQHLHECQRVANSEGVPAPLPVLQGWQPGDYIRGPAYDERFAWPGLVGVGSVCRRHVYGPDGVIAVVEAILQKVPPHVRLHLFGVKSQALAKLTEIFHDRIASVDSMAWNMAARWDCAKAGVPCDSAARAKAMERWYQLQTKQTPQLFLTL
jgi:hypothetical protein